MKFKHFILIIISIIILISIPIKSKNLFINKTEIIKLDGVELSKKFIMKTNYNYNIKDSIEWFPYLDSNLSYDYEPIPYTEEELNLLTNVLYRESGMSYNLNQQVDQYFIVLCGINTIKTLNIHNSIMDLIKNGTSFTWPKNGSSSNFSNELWVKCRDVVKNVLECKIPGYVPYIPMGTVAYWNDTIDTNKNQKKYLDKYYIKVSTTIWGTDYYCHKDYITEKELKHLK